MTLPEWSQVLDDLEQALVAQQAAVDDGRPEDLVAYEPPVGLGPLPTTLEPRARALKALSDQLISSLQASRSATSRELSMLSRMKPGQDSPSYVDSTL